VTGFAHQKRSGRRKKPKQRQRKGLDIRSFDALRAHRELAFLRNPSHERLRKLREVGGVK
jgi:hypothetical protein